MRREPSSAKLGCVQSGSLKPCASVVAAADVAGMPQTSYPPSLSPQCIALLKESIHLFEEPVQEGQLHIFVVLGASVSGPRGDAAALPLGGLVLV